MRKYIIFLGAIYLCLSLSAQTYPKDSHIIRILTYNTHYCKGGTDPGSINDANTRLLASVIKTLDADIVSLQELDSATNSRGKRYLLEQIAKATGLNYTPVYGSASKWDGGSIGCGSLIKTAYPVMKIKKIALPGDEPRIAVRTDFDKFVFISTHGDLNDTKRIQGANIINNELDYIRKPVFLAGDLNDSHRWGNGGIAFPIFMEKFEIASDTKGNTVWNGSNANPNSDQGLIDYILFRDYSNSGIQIKQTHIVRTLEINGTVIDLKNISDHYPVFVDIEIPDYTDIADIEKDSSRIYLDSTGEYLCISGEKPFDKVEIYTLTGQKVNSLDTNERNGVNISRLTKGTYIVKAYFPHQCLVQKIIKN